MSRFTYRLHALQRMFERKIRPDMVEFVINSGITIEFYSRDTPYPSRLVLGWDNNRPVHVVVADNPQDNELIIITVYQPNPEYWDSSFSRRL